MSMTENVDLLAGRIAQEFNAVQAQIAGLSGGGGGGGIVAPTYHGTFAINGSGNSNLASFQNNVMTGSARKAGMNISANSANTSGAADFTLPTQPFEYSPTNIVQLSDGSIIVTNGGKYRFVFQSETVFGTNETQSSQNLKHILRINNVDAVAAVGPRMLYVSTNSNASSPSRAPILKTEIEGIITIPANGELSLSLFTGNVSAGSSFNHYSHLHIESLF